MASPQHQQLIPYTTEVSCDSSGEGGVSVKISTSGKHKYGGSGPLGAIGGGFIAGSKHCKYSISSSCSSGESGARRSAAKNLRSQRNMPQLFERSAGHVWDPKFDSSILEEACRERCFPQARRRFRYVLFYLAAASVLWGLYFAVNPSRCDREAFLLPTASFLLFCLLLFLLTFTELYNRFYNQVSLLLILATFSLTLAPQIQTSGFRDLETSPADFDEGDFSGMGSDYYNVSHGTNVTRGSLLPCISPVGTFSLCMEVLLLLYSVLHIRLYAAVLLGLLYSLIFEGLGWLYLTGLGGEDPSSASQSDWDTLCWLGPAKALLHLCAHAIGIHLFIMSEVRSRSTFLKVGQAIMHGKDLEVEKALKERMIHSVMPRLVADELMKQGDDELGDGSVKRYSSGGAAAAISSPKNNKRKKSSIPRGHIIFRPFNMKRMDPVSILFADIVGFTKMSANKSAHALVGLLNDLFGRFDRLCELTCCEKISTLGDCYYCVAGCPEPRPEHAYCCVEMGLGMIQAIEQFCQEKKEMVNMRVGVHTGTVLCGILGMKRFKFDVWSNDVNLANLMEQLGVAGKVHLSEATANFLDDRYLREDGRVVERVGQSVVSDQLKGLKTYLISGRKSDQQSICNCCQARLGGPEQWGGTPGRTSPGNHGPTGSPAVGSPAVGSPAVGGPAPPERATSHCPSCNAVLTLGADKRSDEQNGRPADRLTNGNKDSSSAPCPPTPSSAGPSPGPGRARGPGGLLNPRPEPLTSSQTSLCEMLQEKQKKETWCGGGAAGGRGVGMDHAALIPLRSKNFRQRSDAHFVDVIKEDSLMKDYFCKPPIHKLSHTFLDQSLESAYRCSYQKEVESQAAVQTFTSPTFSSFLDMVLCCWVFLALSLACFLRPLISHRGPSALALGFTAALALLELLALFMAIRMAFYLDGVLSCTRYLMRTVSCWWPRHLIGAVLVSLPAVAVFSHVTCTMHLSIQFTMFTCCAAIIAIIQYCNFCHLSYWMRSTLATLVGLALVALLFVPHGSIPNGLVFWSDIRLNNSNVSTGVTVSPSDPSEPRPWDLLGPEACVAFFLLLLLVWFLNHEFEVSYRLHYHGNVEADQHRIKIQNMRDQADWLLRNIIPIHVAEQLKVTQSYSKNHDDVGVIFASIVNFSEFYEESYEGGKECYRVLNELIGDFDEQLRKPAFSGIEKIKTIGASYMAASGLSARPCSDAAHPHAHLRALFEFALEMMRVVDDFNKNMLGFGFKLRIGFNHGPLTAGVIGTTKLLYDIWGDTVNIASRMDTTGVECRVQVSEESYCVLSSMEYAFDYRGTVNVKGKGQMKTFLYPKSSESGPVPQYQLSVSPEIRAQVDGSIGRSPTDEIASSVMPVSSLTANPVTVGISGVSYAGHGAGNGLSGHGREAPEGGQKADASLPRRSEPGLASLPVTNLGASLSPNNPNPVISSLVQQDIPQPFTKDSHRQRKEQM